MREEKRKPVPIRMIIPVSISRPISQFISKHRFSSAITPALSPNLEFQVQTILDFVDPIEEPLETLTHLFSASLVTSILLNQQDVEMGFRFYTWAMRRKRFRSWESHNIMVDMIVRQNGFQIAWKLFEEMKQLGILIVPQAFAALITAYAKSGEAEKALESFGRMNEFNSKPNTFTYNAILYLLVRKQVSILAMAVYNQMLKINCLPNRTTFSILIYGLCKAGKTTDALHLFDEMIVRGCSPTQMVYSVVVSSLCRANKTEDALKLFESMKLNSSFRNDSTHNAIIYGFVRAGKLAELFDLVDSWKKEGFVLQLKGYCLLIDGLFKAERFDEACELYKLMLKESIVPNSTLYAIMIKGHMHALKIEEALQFLNEMTDRGFVPTTDVYNSMIKGFCRVKLLKKARSLQQEIKKHEGVLNLSTYTVLISGLCKYGMVAEAQTLFAKMEKQGYVPNLPIFNALIYGFCKIGKLAEAQMLFYKMEIGKNPSLFLRLSKGAGRVLDGASLQTLVEQFCESGLIHKAYKLLRQLSHNGFMPNITTYNILINGFCKSGDINGALKFLKDLQLKGHIPDAVTYATLIDGFLMVKREDDALGLLHQMEINGCPPNMDPYGILMKYFGGKRNLKLAFRIWMKYLLRLPDRDKRELEMVEKSFDNQNVFPAVDRVLKLDTSFTGFEPKLYSIFLFGLCQAGMIDEAVKIFNVLQECKVDVTPPTCLHLISSLCQKNEVDQALGVFLYTLEKGFKLQWWHVCNKLIQSLYFHGRIEDVLDLITRMKSAGYKEFIDSNTARLLRRIDNSINRRLL